MEAHLGTGWQHQPALREVDLAERAVERHGLVPDVERQPAVVVRPDGGRRPVPVRAIIVEQAATTKLAQDGDAVALWAVARHQQGAAVTIAQAQRRRALVVVARAEGQPASAGALGSA